MVGTAYILFVKSSVMSLAHDLCCLLFLPVHIPIFLSIPLSEKLTSLGMVTCRPGIAHLPVSITVHNHLPSLKQESALVTPAALRNERGARGTATEDARSRTGMTGASFLSAT